MTKTEVDYIKSNKLNLQALAANVGYEYASRGGIGRSAVPEPQTYDEACDQLRQDKSERLSKEEEPMEHVTDEIEVTANTLQKRDLMFSVERRYNNYQYIFRKKYRYQTWSRLVTKTMKLSSASLDFKKEQSTKRHGSDS